MDEAIRNGTAWTRHVVKVWERWSFGYFSAVKLSWDGPWHLMERGTPVFKAPDLQSIMAEAGRRLATPSKEERDG